MNTFLSWTDLVILLIITFYIHDINMLKGGLLILNHKLNQVLIILRVQTSHKIDLFFIVQEVRPF